MMLDRIQNQDRKLLFEISMLSLRLENFFEISLLNFLKKILKFFGFENLAEKSNLVKTLK